jgi:D-alanyl-D-alanine carboxypeptidase (penicillin-binding protein 5/6)
LQISSANTGSRRKTAVYGALLCLVLCTAGLFGYTAYRMRPAAAPEISGEDKEKALVAYFTTSGDTARPFTDARHLSPFVWYGPDYTVFPTTAALSEDITARSAILLDAATGSVLFEKNADEVIPPASMTKLAAMYTAFHAAENGEISFDDIVDLPEETWAVNIPPGSSLMFLGEGQTVTVRELLLGMAVVSGNDAAIALAIHISGSVNAFVARMNAEMARLGLNNTTFVEPSGLSGLNRTTAREFADFALIYIRDYPQALKAFHSKTRLEYPMPWNYPEYAEGDGTADRTSITQNSTNRLLGVLEGCDGLKTGFIYESGYNLSLTAERSGTRFISVTMGGAGMNSFEGNALRSRDGTSLMEWAFGNFRTVRTEKTEPISVPVWGGAQKRVGVIPAGGSAFTAPKSIDDAGAENRPLQGSIVMDKWLDAPVTAGSEVGRVNYSSGGTFLYSVPLIADRNVAGAGPAWRLVDSLARLAAPLFD